MVRIKQRSEDFRVRELLREDVLVPHGEWRVYRVVKRKLTSLEAAARLAELAGSYPGSVSMAGLKDRQGVTVQYMALHRGREVTERTDTLRIESVGFAADELGPAASTGNAFEIVVRGLDAEELSALRATLPAVREHGVVNYFDDQRFGNLRHRQGWIALRLMRGEHEQALRALLTAPSPFDDRRNASFKAALARCWGDWAACRDVAGRFRAHHSVFEHLKRRPDDFAGGFQHVATRLRLIHLYAYQSHVWNRAVAAYVRELTPVGERVVVDCDEGPLVFPSAALRGAARPPETFRLPGPGLEDVADPQQRALLADALAADRLVPAAFRIEGVPGFQLKGEDRALFVLPRHLRVRPAEPDPLNRGLRLVKLRFELPRGSYATLVVKRLLGSTVEQVEARGHPARARPGDSAPRRERPQDTRRPPQDRDRGRPRERERGGAGGWQRPERQHGGDRARPDERRPERRGSRPPRRGPDDERREHGPQRRSGRG